MSYRDSKLTRAEHTEIRNRFLMGCFMKEDVERMIDAPPIPSYGNFDDETDFNTGVTQRKDLMCIFWVGKERHPAYLYKRDNEDFKKQLKIWRKQVADGIITIYDCNCRDIVYKGRKYYGFTLSQLNPDTGEVERCHDPLSLFLFGYMCDGLTYWMTAKSNRDMIVKYVMGK